MKVKGAVALSVALVALLVPATAHAQKLIFVVRHAERADGGAGTKMSGADPPLSAEGQARAVRLAAMLADSGIAAIYVTQYLRTQQTAQPLAAKLGVKPLAMPAANVEGLIDRLKQQHARDIVLVVGHSDTLPMILKAYTGQQIGIGENEYSNLFVIVPATGALTRIRF